MQWKISTYCIVTEPFVDAEDGLNKRIVFGTRQAQRRLIDDATCQQLKSGQFDQLPPAVLDDLVKAEIIVTTNENELATILRQNAAAAESTTLYIVVQPSAACQLGCDYCGQRHTARKLSEADQTRLAERARPSSRRGASRNSKSAGSAVNHSSRCP